MLATMAGLSAGLGAAASLVDTGINTWQKYEDRKFNAEEAEKQRSWEQEMSNTAYQRSVADMKAAGINPAMMYANNGQGATTPTGSSASSHASNSSNILSGIANVINSAASLTNNKNVDRETTKQIYNSAGKLLQTVETYSRDL